MDVYQGCAQGHSYGIVANRLVLRNFLSDKSLAVFLHGNADLA